MMRPRFTIFMMIAALGLGVMGGVLLAQQPEETDPPAPFDCSPQGLSNLHSLLEEEYDFDFSGSPTTVTDHLYQLGVSYQLLAMECGHVPTAAESRTAGDKLLELSEELRVMQAESVGSDPLKAMIEITTLSGDSSNGEALYRTETRTSLGRGLACAGCHEGGISAPPTEEMWDLTVDTRMRQPEMIGYIPLYYIVESIIKPDAYIVPGYADIMPHNYGEQMSAQELADIVEYLHTFGADYVSPESLPSIRPAPRSGSTATAPK